MISKIVKVKNDKIVSFLFSNDPSKELLDKKTTSNTFKNLFICYLQRVFGNTGNLIYDGYVSINDTYLAEKYF